MNNIFCKNRTCFFVIITFLIFLPGCFYTRRPAILPAATRGYSDEQIGVECKVQPLSGKESYALFGSDLAYQGYQPCLVELYNNSRASYSLSWRYVSMPLTSHYIIKDVSHYNTSLFAFTTSLLAAIYCWPLIPVVIVPSALAMARFNKEVDQVVDEYGLKDNERITLAPYERLSKIIFIYGWHKGASFDIGLLNSDTHAFIKFTVTL
ncbi:MAG: hypothetical protein WC707_06695 [Candidatus Babeliaceae bacterium]|jgi:hypothetical protein